MSTDLASGPSERAPGSDAQLRARLAELEAALETAQEERASQARAVEGELVRLGEIYNRMRTQLAEAREARDRAQIEVAEERERRARETLELARRLEEFEKAPPPAIVESHERFVQKRMEGRPIRHRRLTPGSLPDLPGFETTERLGRGGMATVYRATRASDGAEVAIKLLHEGAEASGQRTELFLREAAVMLSLDHPGLVRAWDAGECEYGRYLILELVQGESLAARVRREGPLPEDEAVAVALQVGRALRYCSRLGLTHRDVKPSNLLRDDAGHVKICDFGLAALSHGDSGRPYGSPGYAAPEQLAAPDKVDERADIYALGCTLWHLVVGRRPFDGKPAECFTQQREQDLSDPRFEGADVSPRLAQVIRRMGRCERSRRYRSWDECLLDLMLVERGNPPFAAHLSDALAPRTEADRPVSGPVDATPTPRAGLVPATAAAPLLPPPAPGPRGLRIGRGRLVILLLLTGVVAGAVGFGVSADLGADPVETLERRADDMAERGEGARAAESLREAAALFSGADAERLRRLADQLDAR